MAKKSRTPTPPRRPVQAPRQRTGPGLSDAEARRRRLLLYGLAGSGVVALAIVVGLLTLLGGSGGGTSKALAATLGKAGCTLKTYPSQGRRHVALNYKFKYNSFPPTSGPHYQTWAPWGVYETPIREIRLIHNLEHGGVIIQYGSKVPKATVSKLEDYYRSDANAMILAPLPALGTKISLSAWTHLAKCGSFDKSAFDAFKKAYRYHGPEHFPPSALQPGE